MKKLLIIQCGGAKLSEAAPAAELYIGSMFADTLRTARTMTSDENIRILSAKHGLIKLDTIVEPYDVKMGNAGTISIDELRNQLTALREEFDIYTTVIHTLLPKKYGEAFWAAAHTTTGQLTYILREHFAGTKGIGYQKAVLKTIREGVAA